VHPTQTPTNHVFFPVAGAYGDSSGGGGGGGGYGNTGGGTASPELDYDSSISLGFLKHFSRSTPRNVRAARLGARAYFIILKFEKKRRRLSRIAGPWHRRPDLEHHPVA